ncbi:hypothetical protein BH11ARM2_BH11ARM2_04710 [soil metagenome]
MRFICTTLAIAVAARAMAQDGNAGAGGSSAMPIIVAVLVIAIIVLAFIVLRKPKASLPPPELARGEDEVTQVRIQGPRLVRIQGGVKVGAEVPVNGPVTVGRDSACTIRFDDLELSPVHAEFRPGTGGIYVVDKASESGTFVNDDRIAPETPRQLADGDKVRMGGSVLQFRVNA